MERVQGGGNSGSGFRNGERPSHGNYQYSGNGNWSRNCRSCGDWSMPNQCYNSNILYTSLTENFDTKFNQLSCNNILLLIKCFVV